MQIPHDAVLLRIFLGENDRHGNLPLYEAIVLKAREMGLAGATVLRGPMGFGHSSHLHTAKILRLSLDLPFVIEIVDAPEKIDAFLPALSEMMGSGLVTLEKVQVLQVRRQEEFGESLISQTKPAAPSAAPIARKTSGWTRVRVSAVADAIVIRTATTLVSMARPSR